ncbi:glycoside hydrolase family 2 TIM barrel-domain containing protein [Sphingobium sp. Sx8-8]|uniref:glycoside hydrolase family 2 protein n=1 Tax=Sphingobium sp. Sx8-8 TaxID=2933617 RepID=UPI001F599FF0|nr:glycoside hydrolase family 2 TIM barrel-domain containing protein [Sphingobium sp. Sx8-8]
MTSILARRPPAEGHHANDTGGRLCRLFGALLLIALPPVPVLARHAEPSPPALLSRQMRTRLNFNAGWRFILADVTGAQAPGYDDAGWQSVGLPHSFSLPYFQSPSFPVGYGWYRKSFDLPALPAGRSLSLEFEGAFQDAEVFVNGVRLARHRGGYTGFPVDITKAVRPGRNVVAVRVNNRWDATLAPRAGEHLFSGGLYRDLWLVATDAVHVPWTGTFVTTPELSDASGKVEAATEVRNDGAALALVTVRTHIVDDRGRTVATLPDSRLSVPPGRTVNAVQRSAAIARPRLWSPETPVLYRAITRLIVGGRERDRYETFFGFRWFEWTADRGFFLNGRHRYFRGANAHQDQAGWGDAVTNRAIERDVRMLKDAGFDFIRGSHYPHDPHFAETADRVGMLFLSEAPFWGTAGFKSPWAASAYPVEPEHRAAFDASVRQQLAEMIRINRNSPSIIAWSMDNEVFFTSGGTLPEVRRLLKEEVALARALDPSRPAAVSGAQRGDLDRIGDIAGYNGDGARLFPDPGIANFVAEYGSTAADRPGRFEPGWGDLPGTPGADPAVPGSWRLPWRSGEAIWAGFDHGSIAGRQFGSMGIVDYFRLPKRQWYWYRQAYRGIAPPAWPRPGTPAALRLGSSAPVIARADGTDDVQLVVTVVDAAGRPLSNSPPVRLTIESGPGELPTGRTIDFAPDGDIAIRDGQAAIAMRSWQKGTSRIRASSPGLRDAVIAVRTLDGPAFVPGKTALAADRPYRPPSLGDAGAAGEQTVQRFGTDNPTDASSAQPGHPSRLGNDGDPATFWLARDDDPQPWLQIDLERFVEVRKLRILFPQAGTHGFVAEMQDADGRWQRLAAQEDCPGPLCEIDTRPVRGRIVRLRLMEPGGRGGIADMSVMGALRAD